MSKQQENPYPQSTEEYFLELSKFQKTYPNATEVDFIESTKEKAINNKQIMGGGQDEYYQTEVIAINRCLKVLDQQEKGLDANTQSNNNPSGLNLTEQMLIFVLLEKHELFPRYRPDKNETAKQFNILIASLVGSTEEQVKKARRKADAILQVDVTSKQTRTKIENLNNILPTIKNLNNPKISKMIEDLILEIGSI